MTKQSRAAEMASKLPRPPEPRPIDGTGELGRVNVTLRADQVTALDSLAVAMRATSGWPAKRSALLRGMADAVLASDVDLTGCESEADVRDAVAAALAG